MTQVGDAEPEELSWSDRFSMGASCFPALGIREHAALVQAIMLNFPEIYEKVDVPKRVKKPAEAGAWRQAVCPPTSA